MECVSGLLAWIECHPGLASWMQAIFSVLAIVAAIKISTQQRHEDRVRETKKDIHRLRSVKAVLAQICIISQALHKATETNNYEEIYHFDPKFLLNYKAVLQALPLFEIPLTELVVYVNTVPRAIDEVVVRLSSARLEANDALTRYEWLLANDFERRLRNLHNLVVKANNYCFDEVDKLNGWSSEERANSGHPDQ